MTRSWSAHAAWVSVSVVSPTEVDESGGRATSPDSARPATAPRRMPELPVDGRAQAAWSESERRRPIAIGRRHAPDPKKSARREGCHAERRRPTARARSALIGFSGFSGLSVSRAFRASRASLGLLGLLRLRDMLTRLSALWTRFTDMAELEPELVGDLAQPSPLARLAESCRSACC